MNTHFHWAGWLLLVIPLSVIVSITLLVRDELRSRKDRYNRHPTTAAEPSRPDQAAD